MSEQSFEQMLEESLKKISNGDVVEGTVIEAKPDELVVNIGYKFDGFISREEYTAEPNTDLRVLVSEGDKIEAKVLRVNEKDGQVVLSYRRLAADRGNKVLEEAFENKTILKGKVIQVLNGGLNVVVNESRVFIPASLVSDVYEKDLGKFADTEIEFIISEFNPSRRRIIGNRKVLVAEQKEKARAELLERIHEGDTVEGVVKNVTDFGVFVDLGGADGLLHISEMSWGHIENPKKNFKSGDELKVLVKEISGNKIALSLKFADKNPWLKAEEKYVVGSIVKGKVARMTDFGAFIELEPGVDGLLHVSQISRERIKKPSDVLQSGQEIEAKVVDCSEADHKISLSIKALLPEVEEVKEEKVEDDEPHEYIDVDDEETKLDIPNA